MINDPRDVAASWRRGRTADSLRHKLGAKPLAHGPLAIRGTKTGIGTRNFRL
jgi:hypothetical protein